MNIHFNLFQIGFPCIFMTISQNIKLYTLNHVCANRLFFLSLLLFSFHLDDCWQRYMTKFLIALYFRFVYGNFPLFKKYAYKFVHTFIVYNTHVIWIRSVVCNKAKLVTTNLWVCILVSISYNFVIRFFFVFVKHAYHL